MKPTESLQ